MKNYNDIEQGTPEWLELRKGKMTASHAQAIAANGKGLDTYILEVMADKYSSGEREFYTNKDIERGNDLEPVARGMYELRTKQQVQEVGFIEMNEFVGCSPDGLIGEDGGIEIKCVNDKNHFELLLGGKDKIESKYIWQMQMCMYVTGREWWDYISFNPNFKKDMIIHRIKKDPIAQEKLRIGIGFGIEKIKNIISKYEKES